MNSNIFGKAHIIYAEEVYEVEPFVIGVATSEKAALEMISEAQKVMGPAYEYFYDVVDFNTMGMNDEKYRFSHDGKLEDKNRLVDDELLFHRVRVDEDVLREEEFQI